MFQKLFENRLYAFAIVLVIIIIIASAVFPQTFPTFSNFSQILLNLSTDTIVAVGMMLLLISGTFDLSVGSTVAFVACFTSYLMFFYHFPVPIAILCGILSAVIIGLVNGYLKRLMILLHQGINQG